MSSQPLRNRTKILRINLVHGSLDYSSLDYSSLDYSSLDYSSLDYKLVRDSPKQDQIRRAGTLPFQNTVAPFSTARMCQCR